MTHLSGTGAALLSISSLCQCLLAALGFGCFLIHWLWIALTTNARPLTCHPGATVKNCKQHIVKKDKCCESYAQSRGTWDTPEVTGNSAASDLTCISCDFPITISFYHVNMVDVMSRLAICVARMSHIIAHFSVANWACYTEPRS